MEDRLTAVPCVICGQLVLLDECKVTEFGQPMHKACLAELLERQIKTYKTALEHWRLTWK